ncbi:MAG: alpha amylase C-terminal domain-containing protein [Candidatus Cloacimonas sp.]|jgi:1,4-alpha-glucan branching enzyme|nr:alpha amylase C-terminal domain-containing protein [Candidatus Cloacimonas sp.]
MPTPTAGWYAQKRSTLAAALVFTTPGIPMLFQGQEFLEGGKFVDSLPLNWDQDSSFSGIVNLYRDLIRLRLNQDNNSAGLCSQSVHVFHENENAKLIAFHRWDRGGAGDDVIVVANFFRAAQDSYRIGLPHEGTWNLRFNSDWEGYSKEFGNYPSTSVIAEEIAMHGFGYSATISISHYSTLIFAQL